MKELASFKAGGRDCRVVAITGSVEALGTHSVANTGMAGSSQIQGSVTYDVIRFRDPSGNNIIVNNAYLGTVLDSFVRNGTNGTFLVLHADKGSEKHSSVIGVITERDTVTDYSFFDSMTVGYKLLKKLIWIASLPVLFLSLFTMGIPLFALIGYGFFKVRPIGQLLKARPDVEAAINRYLKDARQAKPAEAA